MASTSIRISRSTHQKIKNIADREHKPIGDVVSDAIERYERDEFRRAVHESFRALREDPAEWLSYQEETELWEQTNGDGLESEPPYEEAEQA
jgi:predicted transcriptional regulator